MTPSEVLRQVKWLGCSLTLSEGKVTLSGPGEPPLQLQELIKQHRAELIEWMEASAAHEASLAAGRITELSPRVQAIADAWRPAES